MIDASWIHWIQVLSLWLFKVFAASMFGYSIVRYRAERRQKREALYGTGLHDIRPPIHAHE